MKLAPAIDFDEDDEIAAFKRVSFDQKHSFLSTKAPISKPSLLFLCEILFLSDNIFRNWHENVALTLETQTVVTLKSH